MVLINGAQTSSQQGGPISPVLAMSLTPLSGPLPPGTSPFPAGSPVDAGLQWLVDFDAALAAGMALKIPLNRDQRITGFDRILVYGLRTSGTGADDLGALFDAHHYTDGFALVPPGSPTKSTTDASSAFSRKDPDFAASFAYERGAPLTAQAGCDGAVFASLIGVDAAHLAHTQFADGVNVRSGQDMLTVLWPATLGYFLSQMMNPVFQAGQIETAREYVLANTLPRGAAPAFRVGTTPYGVLPATSLTRYKPTRSDIQSEVVQNGLVAFVTRLWPVWLASSAGAPHMQTTGDPDAELIGLLGMDASSSTFRGRQVMGSDFLWNYMTFLSFPLAAMQAWLAAALSPGRLLLDALGEGAWDPRVIHLGLSGSSFPVNYPTVQSGPLSETDPLTADADLGGGVKCNYVQWLAQASLADIQVQTYPGPTPTSLLYMILRQSLILDYAKLAATAEIAAGRLVASQFREAELIGIPLVTPPAQPAVGVWDLLERPSVPDPTLSWGDYLVTLVPLPSSPYAQLTALRASLQRLAVLPTAELDRLLTETLDACSHRLDVWATTVANAILNRTRAAGVAGVHLGAFGWLEEIRPSPQRAVVEGLELAQVQNLDALRAKRVPGAGPLPTPVQPLVDNGGYIYCPSSEQAAVAAVLRNGYVTHKGTAEEPMLDIDLSSERVRYALSLLQGVQQGQSLNALLGYLFEAGLDALGLQQYTQPFRNLFPVVGSKLTPSSAPSEAVAASNVVDGLALRTAWDDGKLATGRNWGVGLPPPGPDQTAVIGLLTTLDSYFHALGDVSMAEAVFQVIRGNFGRAGGLMDAISKGDRPPDPDVIVTPRGGLDLIQRVAVLIAGTPAAAPAWTAGGVHPRAAAEPWLEAWLTGLLPDPSKVTCSVHYKAGGVAKHVPVSLLQLDVGALDCLAMADAAAIPQKGELEARILYAAALPLGATAVRDRLPARRPARELGLVSRFLLPGQGAPDPRLFGPRARSAGHDRSGERRLRSRPRGHRRAPDPQRGGAREPSVRHGGAGGRRGGRPASRRSHCLRLLRRHRRDALDGHRRQSGRASEVCPRSPERPNRQGERARPRSGRYPRSHLRRRLRRPAALRAARFPGPEEGLRPVGRDGRFGPQRADALDDPTHPRPAGDLASGFGDVARSRSSRHGARRPSADARPVALCRRRPLAGLADRSGQFAGQRPSRARLFHARAPDGGEVRRAAGRRVARAHPQHRRDRLARVSLRGAQGARAAGMPACRVSRRPPRLGRRSCHRHPRRNSPTGQDPHGRSFEPAANGSDLAGAVLRRSTFSRQPCR